MLSRWDAGNMVTNAQQLILRYADCVRAVLKWILVSVGALFLAVCVAGYWAASYLEKSAPRIGNIDLSGLKTIPEQSARDALGVKQGDFAPPSPDGSSLRETAIFLVAQIPGGKFASIDKAAMIQRLRKIPGVENADVATIINPGAVATLFIGIQEHGDASFIYRLPPSGPESLPKEIANAYDDEVAALSKAARNPNSPTRRRRFPRPCALYRPDNARCRTEGD